MGVIDTCKTEEDPFKNKQIQRIYVPRHYLSIWTIMEQLMFAEQKTETKPKHIHIFRPRHKHMIQMFHKELHKTVGAFALKRTTYI